MDNATTAIRIPTSEMAATRDWSVAVAGIDTAPGAAVARCLLAAKGFRGRVLGLVTDGHDSGSDMARNWDVRFQVPEPVAGAGLLLERIDRIRQEEPINAIIPCRDADLPNYITLQPELAQRGIRLMLPDRATLYSRNKDYLPTLCAKAEVATPRVRRITHEGFFDLKGIDGQFWHYPMVVKGIFYDAHVVHGPEEAKQRFHQVAEAWGYPVLVQEFIDGEEVALAALGDGSGATLDVAMFRKQGVSGMTIDDAELRAAGQRLMAALKWRGPLEMEMLRDRTGKLYLIEINPRFPAWIEQTADAGSNLPAVLLTLMQDESLGYPQMVRSSWWHSEPASADRLARFGKRGDHGVPAWSSDLYACPTT